MAEYKTEAQVNYGWGLTLDMTGKAPAISKRIFLTYDDALLYVNDMRDSAIEGLRLSVIKDPDEKKNGTYFVYKIGQGNNEGVLEKESSEPEVISIEEIDNIFNKQQKI